MRTCNQWVLWKTVTRNGEPTKVPFQVNGSEAKSNTPATWTEFNAVVKRYGQGGFDGIGFMFSAQDDFVGVDLDGCRNPANGRRGGARSSTASTHIPNCRHRGLEPRFL